MSADSQPTFHKNKYKDLPLLLKLRTCNPMHKKKNYTQTKFHEQNVYGYATHVSQKKGLKTHVGQTNRLWINNPHFKKKKKIWIYSQFHKQKCLWNSRFTNKSTDLQAMLHTEKKNSSPQIPPRSLAQTGLIRPQSLFILHISGGGGACVESRGPSVIRALVV